MGQASLHWRVLWSGLNMRSAGADVGAEGAGLSPLRLALLRVELSAEPSLARLRLAPREVKLSAG
eukprot:2384043-Lingulodinium_polyedra.AAC.1